MSRPNLYVVTEDGGTGSPNTSDGGGGGMNDDLEKRVDKLETDVQSIRNDLHAIKTDIAVLTANSVNFTTKADFSDLKAEMHKAFNAQTWKLMALIIAVFGLMRAFPPKTDTPQPPVQYMPYQSAPAPSTPPPQSSATQDQPSKPKQ